MRDLHDIAMSLCRVRDSLDPIQSGMIRRGHACRKLGDLTLEPGMRKTKLADAKQIAEAQFVKLNALINELIAYDKAENKSKA